MKKVLLDDRDWEVLTGILLGLKLRGEDKTFPNFESILEAVKEAEEFEHTTRRGEGD